MRGGDIQQSIMFRYLSPEQRVPVDHPLRTIRRIGDKVLARLSDLFTTMYSEMGRPSVAGEIVARPAITGALHRAQ